MKSVFITGSYNQGEMVKNYLENLGIKCKESSYIGYYVVNVDMKNYHNALQKGVKFAVENQLSDVCWVNAYDERQTNSTGAWPVAYCQLNWKKYGLDKKTADGVWVVKPEYWHENGTNDTVPNIDLDVRTPKEIDQMFKDLKTMTGFQFITKFNNADSALDLRVVCDIEKYKEVRELTINYLNQSNLFDKVIPQSFDGTVLNGKRTVNKKSNTNESIF